MANEYEALNSLVENAAKPAGPDPQPPQPQTDPPPGDPPPPPPGTDPPPPPGNDPPPPPPPPAEDTKALLEEFGLNSMDELRQRLAGQKPPETKTPEQIKKEEALLKTSITEFALKNEIMKPEDLEAYERVSAADDESLVYQQFAKDVKDEILEELDEDATEADIQEAIQKRFDQEYPLGSKSEKARARAEQKLQKAASEIRGPLQSSFEKAKSQYQEEAGLRNEYPIYRKNVDGMVKKAIPNEFTFYQTKDGEQDVPVKLKISTEMAKQIEDALIERVSKDDRTFHLHRDNKLQDIQTRIQEEVTAVIWQKFGNEAFSEAQKVFTSLGIAKGSNVGAQNSFATGGAKGAESKTVDANQQAIDSTRKK